MPPTIRTATAGAGPAARAAAPAPPRPAAKADFVVEHISDRPAAPAPPAPIAPPTPAAPGTLPEIEAFDGAVDFNAVAHDAAKAEGLEVQEEVELKPQDLVIEGLAHTQYESGTFAQSREASLAEDEMPTVDLPLIMPDDVPEVTAATTPPAPAVPEWLNEWGLPAAAPPTPGPPPVAPPAPPAAVALSDDDGAADTAALSRAEPVLTETMAELYLRQGHEENALRVYRALLAQRPGDARLRARVVGLTSGGPGLREAARDHARGTGESVHTFLSRILASRPGMPAAPLAPMPEAVTAAVPALAPPPPPAPLPPPPVFADSPLDGAFALSQPEPELENPSPGPGEATRPADDSISLDSVFGEETLRMSLPAAEPPQAPPAPEPAAPAATTGFSFDQFFGPGGPTDAGAVAGAAGGSAVAKGPPRTSSQKTRAIEDEGELDQFQAWLRGLKS
jgi:hypothetical protein